MGTEERERPTLRRGTLLLATFGTAVGVVLVAVLLPEGVRWLALVAAFAAGIGLERFRHSFFPAPPTLRETPEAWKYVLRYEVGFTQLAIAGALIAAAVAVLLISFDSGEETATTGPAADIPSAGPAADVEVRREGFGKTFSADGVRFEVSNEPAAEAAAGDLAGPGEDVLGLSVEIENVDRKGFNPAELSYRLRDAAGTLYSPDRSTAAGSDSLVQLGKLPPGDDVDQQLLFVVPQDTGGLELEFEPTVNAALTVRVPLRGSG
jgi:hypothetical protein